MESREVKQELKSLTEGLGMNTQEALSTLGLQEDDPLIADDSKEIFGVYDTTSGDWEDDNSLKGRPSAVRGECKLKSTDPVDRVAEMFPEIPLEKVRAVYEEHHGDLVAVSDELLNLGVISAELTEQTARKAEEAKNASAQSGRPLSNKAYRKSQKEMKRLARKQQRHLEHEETDIQFIAGQLKVPLEQARELYWTHNSDVAATLIAKMPKQPLVPVTLDGSGVTTISGTANGGRVTVRTHRPRDAAVDATSTVDDVGEYAHLSYGELKRRMREAQLRIDTLTGIARGPDRAKPHNSLRAKDASAELRHWRAELQLMQLAISKPKWLRQSELPAQVLDLHGHTLEQAKIMAVEAIRKFRNSKHTELEIITGAGRHSSQGRAVIKPWLRDYLKSQHVRMRENEGSFVISQKTIT